MARLDSKKLTEFAQAFQDLWVAGMAGTFFFFTWRSLAQDILGTTPQFATDYTLDRVLRYSYLLWLFGYFFIAAIKNKQPGITATWRDIVFDVVQSASSVIAALFLGVVLPLPRNDANAHVAASLAVTITGGLSLWLFARKSDRNINVLRAVVFVVGLVLLGLSVLGPWAPLTLMIVGGLQVILWVVLLRYVWIHLAPATAPT